MLKYLVTGGCGFIGSHLVDLLLQKGFQVRVLDDLSNSTQKNLPPEVEWIYGSITDPAILKKALDQIDGIFHLAAKVSVSESIQKWHTYHLTNSGGMVNLLQQAQGIPLVYASSAAVYGNTLPLPHSETSALCPLSPYALDKLHNEMQAKLGWELFGTPSIGFRLFNIYGPGQNPLSPYAGVISIFSANLLHNQPFKIFGDGEQKRDFVFVKDVAHILLHGMLHMSKGAEIYNLCSGTVTSINTLADLCGQIIDTDIQKEYFPPRKGEITLSFGDPSKLKQNLGVQATTPLMQGLAELMQEIVPKDILKE